MYFYKVAGLIIKSEIEFVGLEVVANITNPDVTIAKGMVPEPSEEYTPMGINSFYAPDKLILHVYKLVSFFVEDGKKVSVIMHPNADNQDVKAFFIDMILPYLLYYRGFTIVRAAGIMVKEQLIILLGVSASFKSTIAAGLATLGYGVVGDDFIAINPYGGSLSIVPSLLPFQLMEDACTGLAVDFTNLAKVRNNLFRYEAPFTHAASSILENGVIYRLNSRNEATTKIEALDGIVKLNSLINNTYCYPFLRVSNQEKQNLKICATMAKHLKFRDLHIGLNTPTLETAKQIIEDIESCVK